MKKEVTKNGTHIEYWRGKKTSEENYKDGKLHGLTTRWDEDGQIRVEINYENGRYHGKKTQYRYGYKWDETNYQNGTINGKHTTFYSNGQKRFEGQASEAGKYDDSEHKRIGKWSFWYKTGEKSQELDYGSRGDLCGEDHTWYKNGQKKAIYSINPHRLLKHWDKEGKDITQEILKDVDFVLRKKLNEALGELDDEHPF
jgi:antitoxin component YwqK of YwqJK toxin-antitoxin module